MPGYDFRSLSPYDFALLARDLLQARLGIQLESFSAGPDSGIDFRFRRGGTNLILQCKHYADSGFAALLSVLRRKERGKIDKLSPTQYILATSVPLTPGRKDRIRGILGPACLSPADIYGIEDLKSILSEHEEIERRHFKLWLTSEPVLRRVLHAGIFSDSETHLDRIRLRLCRYVQNPSFARARDLLSKSHYCIIAGIPGIGKTTLAEVLLADLADRQGFEAFRIAHSLDEIRPVKDPKRRQVFYFDDFLGTTALDTWQRNEDKRLVELMEEAASNQNWRFILTTREYILNAAKFRSEAFAHPRVEFKLCVVKLEDYTAPIRARILYNHIYFSNLPRAHKLALLQNRAYESVLGHRNYSPRIVEFMTQTQDACAIAPSLYVSEFKDSLEHPIRIWDHPFRHRISEASRHLLLVLATLPEDVLLEDLEAAFWTFYRYRQGRFGFPTKSGDWTDALKELDGSFVLTRKMGRDIAVSFHSSSVRDYLEDFLSNSDGDVLDLIHGARFYEQYVGLWKGKAGRPYPGVERDTAEFLRGLGAGIFGPSARGLRTIDVGGRTVGLRRSPTSNEQRGLFAAGVARELKSGESKDFLAGVVAALRGFWGEGRADRLALVGLLQSLTELGMRRNDEAFLAAKRCLSTEVEEMEDYRAVAEFVSAYPSELPPSELERLASDFREFAVGYFDDDCDDPEWLRDMADDLEFVGERLGVDVTEPADSLRGQASDMESDRPSWEPDEDAQEEWGPAPEASDVHGMFDSLREELEP